MNVYSIVPSQRSHATVSVTISKMIPRNAQMTPPTSSFVASSFRAAGDDVDAARDEHDRQRVRDRPEQEREIPEEVALGQVEVALDDAVEADQLVAKHAPAREGRCRRVAHHANTSLSSSSSVCSSSYVRPVAAKNASSSVSTP